MKPRAPVLHDHSESVKSPFLCRHQSTELEKRNHPGLLEKRDKATQPGIHVYTVLPKRPRTLKILIKNSNLGWRDSLAIILFGVPTS